MADAFDPYYEWLGIPAKDQPPHHYRLLGLDPLESNGDVIARAADRQMAFVRTFQSGRSAAASQRLLNELSAARSCLLDVARKAEYDAELSARLPPANVPPEPRLDGAVFGEYLLLDQLGSGGTGQVFLARHRTMGRVVALKVLSEESTQSAELVDRFLRKARILANLQHPNLVTGYDAGEREGTYFLAMEYVDGCDLVELRRRYGPTPTPHVLNYVMQAAAGLAYAHAQGVLHRNVKPSNLMVDAKGVVKVIGLGVARVIRPSIVSGYAADPELTLQGRVIGTYDYMAPEQALDSTKVDVRADVYGLGCTLYTLLSGRPPYAAKTAVEKVAAHRTSPIPLLASLRPDIPAGLDEVFRRMVAKRPEDRIASMHEVIAALQAAGG